MTDTTGGLLSNPNDGNDYLCVHEVLHVGGGITVFTFLLQK